MGRGDIVLGENRYGKAETRLVRITRDARDGHRHEVKDLNVSVALAGDFKATHLTGDNANVLPTDTQKNTVYAFAKEYGVGEIEAFGLELARHFITSHAPIERAVVRIEEYGWDRIQLPTGPAPHSFARTGGQTRTAEINVTGESEQIVSGLTDLVVLSSTGSEFHGFPRDRYTTLPETTDRVLATAVTARWRHRAAAKPEDGGWGTSFAETRRHLLEAFAETHSLSLQQTLYAMGERVLQRREELVEIRLSLPNRHHLLVDLSPFGLTNDNEVFYSSDRPYGLIEGTVRRDGEPTADLNW